MTDEKVARVMEAWGSDHPEEHPHCSYCLGGLPASFARFEGWRPCPHCGSKLVSRGHPLYNQIDSQTVAPATEERGSYV